eukprot:PhM_4_TR8430/c1_g4_i5/m.4046
MLSLLVVYSDNVKSNAVRKAVDKALSQYPEEDIANLCDSVCGDLSLPSIGNVDVEALSKLRGRHGTVTRIVFVRLIRMLWDDIIFPNALPYEDFDTAWVLKCVDRELGDDMGEAKHDGHSATMSWNAARRISSLAEGDEVLS